MSSLQLNFVYIIQKTIDYLDDLNLYHITYNILNLYYDIDEFIKPSKEIEYKQVQYKNKNYKDDEHVDDDEEELNKIKPYIYENYCIYKHIYSQVKRERNELKQHFQSWIQKQNNETNLCQISPFIPDTLLNKMKIDYSCINCIFTKETYDKVKHYNTYSLFLQKTKTERLEEFYHKIKEQNRMYDLMRKYNLNGLKLLIQYSLYKQNNFFTAGEIIDIQSFLLKIKPYIKNDEYDILYRCANEIQKSIQTKENIILDEL